MKKDPKYDNAVLTNHNNQELQERDGLTGFSIDDFNNTNCTVKSSFQKQFSRRIVNNIMESFFPSVENYMSDFFQRFNKKLSDHNLKSLMEDFSSTVPSRHLSLMTIPLTFGYERWEYLWDHILDDQTKVKESMGDVARLKIFDSTETTQPHDKAETTKPHESLKRSPITSAFPNPKRMKQTSTEMQSSSKANPSVQEMIQKAIPWSFNYKDEKIRTTIKATNTCPLDTGLQLLYCLWNHNVIL